MHAYEGDIDMPSKISSLNSCRACFAKFTCAAAQELNGTEAQDRSNAVWDMQDDM